MCLDDQVLSTYIDGELAEPWKTQVEAHLSHCSSCKSRYNQLLDLEKEISSARLREEEFSVQRERIWQYLEKNCVSAVKNRFAEKRFTIKAPVFVAAAAAIVLFFSAGIYFAAVNGNKVMNEIPVSTEQPNEEITATIIPVRASDSAPAAQSLQDLTIEEILKLLDERGFEVDLRLKSVEPLTVSTQIVLSNGEIIDAEIYYDDEGNPYPVDKTLLGTDGLPVFTLLNAAEDEQVLIEPPKDVDTAVADEAVEVPEIEPVAGDTANAGDTAESGSE